MPQSSKIPASKASDGQVSDAVKGNWVDTIAPPWARPYLRLSRADRPIGTWLLYIPCLWAITLAMQVQAPNIWDIWLIVSCGMGAILMRGAGCTWNDITDRHIDAKVERTRSRPLPSGQITLKSALGWMIVQALIACMILLSYGIPAIIMGIASTALVFIYPFAKRFTWWPQAFLGLAINWGALLMWVAHGAAFGAAPIFLYVAGIFWTLYYDTIYAHQDIEDDAMIGVKSTARLFGTYTPQWMWGFVFLASAFMVAAVISTGISGTALIVCLLGCLTFSTHLIWQNIHLNIYASNTLLHLFRVNRDAGLIPVPFFAIAAML